MDRIELGDLFDDGAMDDDLIMPAPLPDLDDDEDGTTQSQQGGANAEEAEEEIAKLRDLSKGAAKRTVQRPQPKLNPDRLQTDKGLPALANMFENVKFKGKGHEKEDLNLMMGKLEHWSHRLFPKLPFDEFIERLEKLGGKRAVQTCVKKIRMDMPLLGSDFVSQQDDDLLAPPAPDGLLMDQNNASDEGEIDAELAFENMIQQERQKQAALAAENPDEDNRPDTPVTPSSVKQKLSQSTTPTASTSQTPSQTPKTPATSGSGLTEEQKARIEKMKQLALEKRLAKKGITPVKPNEQPKQTEIPSEQTPKPVENGFHDVSSDSVSKTAEAEAETSTKDSELDADVEMETEEEALASLQTENKDATSSETGENLQKESAKKDSPPHDEEMQTEGELLDMLDTERLMEASSETPTASAAKEGDSIEDESPGQLFLQETTPEEPAPGEVNSTESSPRKSLVKPATPTSSPDGPAR